MSFCFFMFSRWSTNKALRYCEKSWNTVWHYSVHIWVMLEITTGELSNRVAREWDVRVSGVVFLDGSEVHKVEVVERTLRNMAIKLCTNITVFHALCSTQSASRELSGAHRALCSRGHRRRPPAGWRVGGATPPRWLWWSPSPRPPSRPRWSPARGTVGAHISTLGR